jgi:hypothetical protein
VEESVIVERLLVMGRWGFPLNHHDLAHLIKSYLDRLGKSTRFVDNMPGPDFTKGFLKRHPQLTVRVANLIKRSRAALSHEDVNSFFDRFENSIGNIPPQNLWNYDETNMRDNPGAQKAIFQKGVKYAEQVRDHSKSSISLTYCYNGVGDSIPPFSSTRVTMCIQAGALVDQKDPCTRAPPRDGSTPSSLGSGLKRPSCLLPVASQGKRCCWGTTCRATCQWR